MLKWWVRRMTMQRWLVLFAQLLLWLKEQGWAPSCSAHLLSTWGDKRINTCTARNMHFTESSCMASLALIQQDTCKSTPPHGKEPGRQWEQAPSLPAKGTAQYAGCQLTHLDIWACSPVTTHGTHPGTAASPPSQWRFPTMSARNIHAPLFSTTERKEQLYCFQGAPEGSPWITSTSPCMYIKVPLLSLTVLELLSSTTFAPARASGGDASEPLVQGRIWVLRGHKRDKAFPHVPGETYGSLHTAMRDCTTYTSPQISFMSHALNSLNWHCSEDSIETKLIYFPLSVWDLVLGVHTH